MRDGDLDDEEAGVGETERSCPRCGGDVNVWRPEVSRHVGSPKPVLWCPSCGWPAAHHAYQGSRVSALGSVSMPIAV